MSNLRSLLLTVALAMLLAGSPPRAEEPRPQILPTRDVDISYKITRPQQPTIIQRRRWLASERLLRADSPDKAATIFDRNAREITVLNPANRTYLKLEGEPRLPLDPEKGEVLKRGGDSTEAGLNCVDWSWTEGVETHTVCLTPDGVLLRLVVDGNTVMQARSVSYARQPAKLFQLPPDYTPGLAQGGDPGW